MQTFRPHGRPRELNSALEPGSPDESDAQNPAWWFMSEFLEFRKLKLEYEFKASMSYREGARGKPVVGRRRGW